MADTEKKSIIDMVNDFLADKNHTDEDCTLVFTLYSMLLDSATENAVLEMENSLLEREINIAENAIVRLNEEKDNAYTA